MSCAGPEADVGRRDRLDRAKRTIFASKAVNLWARSSSTSSGGRQRPRFAFTLGLTVIVDLLVTVLFTHPMMQVLAARGSGDGHPMSGMDPAAGRRPGDVPRALNIDLDRAKRDGTKKGSFKEAQRRQKQVDRREVRAHRPLTLAERKAREARQTADSSTDAQAGENR